MKNVTDLLIRVRRDRMSRVNNDAESKTRQKSRVKNDADLLLKVRRVE